jgi:hypothetical protein
MSTRISHNGFQTFKRSVHDNVRQINRNAGEFQKDLQIQLCPVGEEEHVHLYETIDVVEEGDVVKVVEGDSDHLYWLPLEYGSENSPAQPHIRPAHAAAIKQRNADLAKLRSKY